MGDASAARSRRIGALAALALLLAAPAPRPAPEPALAQEAARGVVQDTVDAVLGVLQDESLALEEQRARIEVIVLERFDFRTISKLILARSWRRLSPEQRADFEREFKRHLSLTYGSSLKEYRDETVEIDSARAERNGDVTVRTRILGASATPVAIDYRLRNRDSRWHMIDVIVEGVSMLQNFRTQMQEIINDVGPERLIEMLHEKNEARTS